MVTRAPGTARSASRSLSTAYFSRGVRFVSVRITGGSAAAPHNATVKTIQARMRIELIPSFMTAFFWQPEVELPAVA